MEEKSHSPVSCFAETGKSVYGIKCISHRGEEFDAPEGSRPSYELAVERKADIVKLDVCFTKDGIPVMSHDTVLKRTMGWDVAIQNQTYREIQEKGVFLKVGEYGNEKIVTFSEVLQIVKGVPEFWIDFKSVPAGGLEKLVSELSKADISLNRVMFATFDQKGLADAKVKYPGVRRVAHTCISRVADGSFTANFGAGKFDSKEALIKAVLSAKEEFGLYGVNLPVTEFENKSLIKEDLQALRQAGLWCSLWFIHTAETAAYAETLGCDAFVTGRINAVRPYCRHQAEK